MNNVFHELDCGGKHKEKSNVSLVDKVKQKQVQGSNPVMSSSSSTVLELYLAKGCFSGESFAQTAHNETLLFTLSDSPRFTRGIDRVLSDANSVPLLRAKTAKTKGWSVKKRVDVYKGNSTAESDLAFTVLKVVSLFSRTLHIFLAGSSLDGPPDYKLKPPSFRKSLKIFRHEDVVAQAKKHLIICGCSPPYHTITISSGMDQAMAVLLVAIHEDLRPKQGSDGGGGGGGGGPGGGGDGGGGF